jgi:MFS family permease
MKQDDRLPFTRPGAGAVPVGTSSSLRDRQVLMLCLLASAIPLADMGLMNVALPLIVDDLGLGVGQTKAVLALHALAFGALLVPGGRLGDRYGQRRLLAIGLTMFLLGAVASSLAPSAGWLIAARISQGAAAGLLSPQVGGLIQRSFSGQARARAFGLMGATIAVATSVGPVLGGLLIGVVSGSAAWRVAMLIGLLTLLPLALMHLLPSGAGQSARDLDPVAVVVVALLALGVLLPLVVGVRSWWSVLFVLLVPVTAFLAWWERRYQRSGRLPLLPPALLHDRLWVRGTVLIAFFLAASTALPLLVSLHAQLVLDADALQAGLAMLPYAACSALGAVVAGRWVLRAGARVIAYGCVTFCVPLTVLLLIGPPRPHAGGWHLIVVLALLAVAGLGTGAVISPNQSLSYRDVPREFASNASGLLLTAQRIGGASGAAVVTTLFFSHGHTGSGRGTDTSGALAAIVVLAALAMLVLVVSRAAARHGRSGA